MLRHVWRNLKHQTHATCSESGESSGREVLVAATVEMKMLMDEVAAVEQQLRNSLGRGDLADVVVGMQAAEKEKLRMTVSLQVGGNLCTFWALCNT